MYLTNTLDLPILLIVIAWQPCQQGIKFAAGNHGQRHEMQNGLHVQATVQHQCGSFES